MRRRNHLFEIEVETPGRLVFDTCGSETQLLMQLFQHDGSPSANPTQPRQHPDLLPRQGRSSWEPVRGFDDERCVTEVQDCLVSDSGLSRAALVTTWLEPGTYALLVELDGSVTFDPSDDSSSNYSFTVALALGNASSAFDVYGLGLDNDVLSRVGALASTAGFLRSYQAGIPTDNHMSLYYTSIVRAPITGHLYALSHSSRQNLGQPGVPHQVRLRITHPVTRTVAVVELFEELAPAVRGFQHPWGDMVYDPITEKLYAMPAESDAVLVVDPRTHTVSDTAMVGLSTASANLTGQARCPENSEQTCNWRWHGAAYAPTTGLIYAPPVFGDFVLIISPQLNTTDATAMPVRMGGKNKWFSAAFAPSTGLIYCTPGSASSVLIINPDYNTTDHETMVVPTRPIAYYRVGNIFERRALGVDHDKWYGAALADSTGLIYSAPDRASSVLVISPLLNSTATIDVGPTDYAGDGDAHIPRFWTGIAYHPELGLLFCPASDATMALIINPVTSTTHSVSVPSSGTDKWRGIVYDPETSSMFCGPRNAVVALEIGMAPDPCAVAHTCARTCLVDGCGWDDDQGLCRSDGITSRAALSGNYGRGVDCAEFNVSRVCAPQFQYSEPDKRFVEGQSLSIRGPELHGNCSNPRTAFVAPTAMDFSKIQYGLTFERDDGGIRNQYMHSCTNPLTGSTTFENLVIGNYTATLFARDGGSPPQETTLTQFPMHVKRYELAVAEACRSEQQRIQSEGSANEYFVGDNVNIAGFSSSCDPASAFEGAANPDGMYFRLLLEHDSRDAPFVGTKMLDEDSGELLIIPGSGSDRTNFTATLVAIDGDRNLTVAEWSIAPKRHSDLDSTVNGPNGSDCARGVRVDVVPFDGMFTCDCEGTGYTGDNCADAVHAGGTSSSTTKAAEVTGAVLGSVIFVIAAAAVAFRVQVYRLKHRPVDMDAMQAEVREGLGMSVPNIRSGEFGLVMSFEAELEAELDPVFKKQLRATVARHVPRIASELQNAKITISELNPRQLLLVMPRPRGYDEQSDIAERCAATISKLARKRKLSVKASVVHSASVAVPIRVPREFDRKQLTRVTQLGEGAFGEVHLYQVEQRGVPPYKVAAKTIKPGATVGRDELLKEAALTALMEHRNVVKLVGVVTAPRDLPALILLEFCDGGELLVRLREQPMTTAKKLTYAAQIALGMQYVAARNVVHRDLAARNVLLDTMGMVRIADFGMSASLVQQGKTYAAQYVRLHEDVALRWAAPEALQHQKFSAASDVWAYGVTVWEIFSAGAEPYGTLGLGEVGAFVKSGGRLKLPAVSTVESTDGCPTQVFDELIMPCWATDPNNRPGFGELYDMTVKHGALEDAVTLQQKAEARQSQTRRCVRRSSLDGNRAYLAPSVRYFQEKLLPMVIERARPVAEANRAGRVDPNDLVPIFDANDATSYQIKNLIVLPDTVAVECPRDHQMGAAFVDTLVEPDVGPATAILSYCWKYPINLVVGALAEWCRTGNTDPRTQYVWMDILCWNQHPGRLSDPVGEWTPRVAAIKHQLTMLHPWNQPICKGLGNQWEPNG